RFSSIAVMVHSAILSPTLNHTAGCGGTSMRAFQSAACMTTPSSLILSGSTTGFGGGGGGGGGAGFGGSGLVSFGGGDGNFRPSKKSGRASDCENVENAGWSRSAITP